jgi:hypothetical protein
MFSAQEVEEPGFIAGGDAQLAGLLRLRVRLLADDQVRGGVLCDT